jgi:hypothetical protein
MHVCKICNTFLHIGNPINLSIWDFQNDYFCEDELTHQQQRLKLKHIHEKSDFEKTT